jgi:hypothetical protein
LKISALDSALLLLLSEAEKRSCEAKQVVPSSSLLLNQTGHPSSSLLPNLLSSVEVCGGVEHDGEPMLLRRIIFFCVTDGRWVIYLNFMTEFIKIVKAKSTSSFFQEAKLLKLMCLIDNF